MNKDKIIDLAISAITGNMEKYLSALSMLSNTTFAMQDKSAGLSLRQAVHGMSAAATELQELQRQLCFHLNSMKDSSDESSKNSEVHPDQPGAGEDSIRSDTSLLVLPDLPLVEAPKPVEASPSPVRSIRNHLQSKK